MESGFLKLRIFQGFEGLGLKLSMVSNSEKLAKAVVCACGLELRVSGSILRVSLMDFLGL